MKINNIIFDHW